MNITLLAVGIALFVVASLIKGRETGSKNFNDNNNEQSMDEVNTFVMVVTGLAQLAAVAMILVGLFL